MNSEDRVKIHLMNAFPKVDGEEKNEITRWIFKKLSLGNTVWVSNTSEVKDVARLEMMNNWTGWFYLYNENLGSMKNWKNWSAVFDVHRKW